MMQIKLENKIRGLVPTLRKRATLEMTSIIVYGVTEDEIIDIYKLLWNEYKIRYYYIEYNPINSNLMFYKIHRITKLNYNKYDLQVRMKNIYRWNYVQKIIGKEKDIVFEEESNAYEVYKTMEDK